MFDDIAITTMEQAKAASALRAARYYGEADWEAKRAAGLESRRQRSVLAQVGKLAAHLRTLFSGMRRGRQASA